MPGIEAAAGEKLEGKEAVERRLAELSLGPCCICKRVPCAIVEARASLVVLGGVDVFLYCSTACSRNWDGSEKSQATLDSVAQAMASLESLLDAADWRRWGNRLVGELE